MDKLSDEPSEMKDLLARANKKTAELVEKDNPRQLG